MEKVLVNLKQALEKAGLSESRFQHDWIKRIIGLNKEVDNGWSLLGNDFVKKWNCQALLHPGLYLLHDRTREIPYRSELFELLPDASIKLIDHQEVKTEDWAVLLWQPIENWFAQQKKIAAELKAVKASLHDGAPPESSAVIGGELGVKLRATHENDQKPLRHFVIKFAIQGWSNFPRKVKASKISEMPTNEMDLFLYLEAIASEFDVHRAKLPKVWKEGSWVCFHVEHPGDDQ